jgi:hypothetical protein
LTLTFAFWVVIGLATAASRGGVGLATLKLALVLGFMLVVAALVRGRMLTAAIASLAIVSIDLAAWHNMPGTWSMMLPMFISLAAVVTFLTLVMRNWLK